MARYLNQLSRSLDEHDILSSYNSWIFANSDQALTKTVRESITHHARNWLNQQSESVLKTLYYDHVAVGDILSSDILRVCLECLAPDPDEEKPLAFPISDANDSTRKNTDELSSCLLVSKEWNEWCFDMRYEKMDHSGFQITRHVSMNEDEFAESLSQYWCRRKSETLRFAETARQDCELVFRGVRLAGDRDTSLRIHAICTEDVEPPVLDILEESFAEASIFSEIETIHVYWPTKFETVTSFLGHVDGMEERLKTFVLDLDATELEEKPLELLKLFQMLPLSITEFCMPRGASPTAVSCLLGALPNLESLSGWYTHENEFETIAKLNMHCLKKLRMLRSLQFLGIGIDPELRPSKAVELLVPVIENCPELHRVLITLDPETKDFVSTSAVTKWLNDHGGKRSREMVVQVEPRHDAVSVTLETKS